MSSSRQTTWEIWIIAFFYVFASIELTNSPQHWKPPSMCLYCWLCLSDALETTTTQEHKNEPKLFWKKLQQALHRLPGIHPSRKGQLPRENEALRYRLQHACDASSDSLHQDGAPRPLPRVQASRAPPCHQRRMHHCKASCRSWSWSTTNPTGRTLFLTRRYVLLDSVISRSPAAGACINRPRTSCIAILVCSWRQ